MPNEASDAEAKDSATVRRDGRSEPRGEAGGSESRDDILPLSLSVSVSSSRACLYRESPREQERRNRSRLSSLSCTGRRRELPSPV